MAAQLFEDRTIKVPREAIDYARAEATNRRRTAEDAYRRELALASKWELFASLLEQGYGVDEAKRRAFHPRVES